MSLQTPINNTPDETAESLRPAPSKLVDQFRAAVTRATIFLVEAMRSGEPSPHPEFRLIDEWNWNTKGLHTSGRAPSEFKGRVV